MKANSILISVLMPVYNSEKYLKEAIESILDQSYKNIELLIINDGSKDGSDKIIRLYKDKRIRYISFERNLGLVHVLNLGLKIAKGNYIARMDADDISLPDRMQKQINFLNKNKDYGMVGTLYANMNENREIYEIGGQLLDYEEIKTGIFFINAFCHGSVMFRSDFLRKNKIVYKYNLDIYEDYELWIRLAKITKVANLDEVLYLYMQNPNGMFSGKSKREIEANAKTMAREKQKTLSLNKVNLKYLRYLIKRSKRYLNKKLAVKGKFFDSNLMLSYQTYLYKLGLNYLNRRNLAGLLILSISFSQNPANWIRKIFKII